MIQDWFEENSAGLCVLGHRLLLINRQYQLNWVASVVTIQTSLLQMSSVFSQATGNVEATGKGKNKLPDNAHFRDNGCRFGPPLTLFLTPHSPSLTLAYLSSFTLTHRRRLDESNHPAGPF
jgi:hypothetical protein